MKADKKTKQTLCPFCQQPGCRTSAFNDTGKLFFDTESGHWVCVGCKRHGDVVDIIAHIYNCDPEALRANMDTIEEKFRELMLCERGQA